MVDGPSPPPRGGLSLYANLLDPSKSAPGTISSAPVSYKPAETVADQDEAAKKQQALAASLRFQPTKRPQIAAQKAKAKAIASKFAIPSTTATATVAPGPQISENFQEPSTETADAKPLSKTTIADWTNTADDDDVNNFFSEHKRGGRKKRKKNKGPAEIVQSWDDIYDPSRPNNYEDYKHSEEKIREVREWKDLLYRRKLKRRTSSDYGSEESDGRPMNRQFAPPPSMSFAPPANLNRSASRSRSSTPPPPPPHVSAGAQMPDDATGEDAYARRLRLSQMQFAPAANIQPPPPPPPPTSYDPLPPPDPPSGQISKAPVRYNAPPLRAEMSSAEAEMADRAPGTDSPAEDKDDDQPRSNRPGQAGFAQRLLEKYGWSAGQGLGAQGTGIINPLYAKADKRKKKADAEGGGWAGPSGTGKILGGHKSKSAAEEEGKFGAMSEVVKLDGMLNGLDLDEEMQKAEGGIMQEIGEECSDKYGSVERVYIHRTDQHMEGGVVFVQFVSQLSALRAVNALEGRIFNGNAITARFWPKEKFDQGQY